jgi:hypothetical protein
MTTMTTTADSGRSTGDGFTVERWLRLIAGFFVIASVVAGVLVDRWFLAFTVFVGLNLFQSAFTDWCPMMWILRKAGARREEGGSCCGGAA